MKRLRKILILCLAISTVGGIMAFNLLGKKELVNSVEMKILGDEKNKFITEDEIDHSLNSLYLIRPGQTKTNEINIQKLEALLSNNIYVKDVNCYFTNSGRLMIEITPKEPVVRIIKENDISYYLDQDARILPLNKNYSPQVPFFIVKDLPVNREGLAQKKSILTLAHAIQSDELLKVMVDHVACDKNKFTIYDALNGMPIYFGDTSQMNAKIGRINYYYKSIAPKKGWDQYLYLDCSYQNQIICGQKDSIINAQENRNIKP
jgi:cell division protein FtsQ